jgi:hypothetical protein
MSRILFLAFLFIQIFAVSGSSASAGLACFEIFKSAGSSTSTVAPVALAKPVNVMQSQPIKLKDGDTYWGLYDCKSCGHTNTMQPSTQGRIQCVGCGTPHTGEKYREPAVFEKDRALWLVDPGQLSRSQQEQNLAKGSDLMGCPFCGNVDFKLGVSCAGCGASAKDASQVRSSIAALRSSTSPRVATNTSGLRISNLTLPAQPNRMTPFTKRVLGMAAGITIAAATTFGTVWGLSTHSEVARVVQIEASQVVIEYSVDNYSHRVELARPAGETLQWRIGEPVTVSFINWKMGDPSGAIRGNGDALQFLND